ncbi:MAG: YiiD C-terminal domain-containing protein [Pirellulales bacterium]
MSSAPPPSKIAADLRDLQETLVREIPMCAMMGIRVVASGDDGLTVELPLDPNRNHRQTAFAGSLNALCTVAGWGATFLLLRELGQTGDIVIRRSAIRYQQPVDWRQIVARCHPVTPAARQYFLEMLEEKGQGKLDLVVEIASSNQVAVVFHGSYVVSRATHP